MIYGGLSYVFQFLCYYLCYRSGFLARFRNARWLTGTTIGTFLLYEVLTYFQILKPGQSAIMLCGILGIMILAKENRLHVFFLFPIVYVLSGIFNILVSFVLFAGTGFPYEDFLKIGLWGATNDGITFLIFFLYFIFNRKSQREMIKLQIGEYLIVLVGAACLYLIVAVSQGVVDGRLEIISSIIRVPFAIGITIFGILFMMIVLWQSYVRSKALQYKAENELYKQFLESQERQIHEVIEADELVRRFRHDLKAHVAALEGGVAAGDLEFLKQYLERMKQEVPKRRFERYTGVAAVDAIIGEWHQKAKDQGITWKWEGQLQDHNKVEIFDLCVIVFNLLSNAVEAASKLEEGVERYVDLRIGVMQERVVIRVANSCQKELNEHTLSRTTKSDVQNHGFGLKNVADIVEKTNGEMKRRIHDGVYEVDVIL